MKKTDYLFLSLIYLPVFPVLLCISGWWLSLPFFGGNQILIFAVLGLLGGLLIDLFFLKKWLRVGYNQRPVFLVLIYLFYSAGLFGAFMGFPVFNVLLGVSAGIFVTRKARTNNLSKALETKHTHRAVWFATVVLACVCMGSAYLAVSDPYTASNLSGMLGLNFKLTNTMIWIIIVTGGLTLLWFQYWSMRFFGKKARKYLPNKMLG